MNKYPRLRVFTLLNPFFSVALECLVVSYISDQKLNFNIKDAYPLDYPQI